MSKSESSALAGSFYPSPPASPRLTTQPKKPALNEVSESPNAESSKKKIASQEPKITADNTLLQADSAAPTEKTLVTRDKKAEALKRLKEKSDQAPLKVWKKAMSLDNKGRCDGTNRDGGPCEWTIPETKTAEVDALIQLLRKPCESAAVMEAHLNSLALLVYCPEHLNPPIRWDRINKWLAAMPGGPYEATSQRTLRNKWTWTPNQCSYTTQQGTLCGTPMGLKCRANKYYCKRTIDEIVQLVTTPRYEGITLDYLLEVLHHHMRCYKHFECHPKPHSRWEMAVASFKEAFWALRDYESLQVNGDSARLRINSRRPEKLASQYWSRGFDTNPFNVLRKGDIFDDGKTPHQMVHDVAKQSLNNDPEKKCENEVNSGYVYIYTVPGNDGFVKIGFTGRDEKTRQKEWNESCNRQHAVVYTTKLILHAHRVERLVHAELMEQRIRIYCGRCGYQHIEWFETSKEVAMASVKKWALWIAGAPYKEKDSVWNLKAGESKKLEDIETFLKGLEDAVRDAEQTAKSTAVEAKK